MTYEALNPLYKSSGVLPITSKDAPTVKYLSNDRIY